MVDDNIEFLGKGWGFPPSFTKGGRHLEFVYGEKTVEQSLWILLRTLKGERLLEQQYGCDLNAHIFAEKSRDMIAQLKHKVTQAIINFETRIKINEIDVTEDARQQDVILLKIDYTIKTTNSRFNMVYPFYLNEAM